MHYVHHQGLPLPVVQKQVGHKTLKATSVYLRPSDELVGEAYAAARHHFARTTNPPKRINSDVTSSLYYDDTRHHAKG